MPSIVAIPGLLCTASVFDGLRRHPALVAMRVLDLADISSFQQMAARLAESLEPDSIVVGMSMGSYLALEVAQVVPQRVKGLVLISTQAAADTPDVAAMRAKSAAWARRAGVAALAKAVADQMLGPTARQDAALRSLIAAMADEIGVETFARHQAALVERPDQTFRLGAITCPVLVLTGTEDAVTPPDAGRAVAEAMQRGRFHEIDGAGHLPVLEAPEAVSCHVAAFAENVCGTVRA